MQEKTKDCESEVENMAKFGINDILNAKTKAAGQQAQTEGYKEIYLSPYEVKAAQENTHQRLENIEELADSFLHVGQEQPTVLARVNGEYRIIDGHRRNAANILNLERGHKEYEKVLYRFMDMSEASAVSNGIVPRSVWTLGHRPKCSPEGMVYLGGGTWVDIYLNSDDGAKGLKSEYGCAPILPIRTGGALRF